MVDLAALSLDDEPPAAPTGQPPAAPTVQTQAETTPGRPQVAVSAEVESSPVLEASRSEISAGLDAVKPDTPRGVAADQPQATGAPGHLHVLNKILPAESELWRTG